MNSVVKKLWKPVETLILMVSLITVWGMVNWLNSTWLSITDNIRLLPMAPSTAVIILILCTDVVLSKIYKQKGKYKTGIHGSLGLVSLYSLFIVLFYVLRDGIPYLERLWGGFQFLNGVPMGVISPHTASVALLTCLAIWGSLNVMKPRRLWRYLGLSFAILNTLFCLTMVMSYNAGMPLFVKGTTPPMAFLTSIAMLLLNYAIVGMYGRSGWMVGILSSPEKDEEDKNATLRNSTAYAFMILSILITVSGQFFLKQAYNTVKQNAYHELSSMSKLKNDQIRQWYSDRIADATVIQNNKFASQMAVSALHGNSSPALRAALISWMRNRFVNYKYNSIILFDRLGNQVVGVPENNAVQINTRERNFYKCIISRQIMIEDLHEKTNCLLLHEEPILMGIWIPIMLSDSTVEGVWLVQLNPEDTLYPILRTWPTFNKSGETLLVRREANDVVYLNPLRFHKDAACKLRLNLDKYYVLPEAMAMKGKKGVVEGMDYRSMAVLAAADSVKGTPWYSVVKMDRVEIYRVLYVKVWTVWAFTILSIIVVALCFGIWNSMREKKISAMVLKSEALMRGLFDNMTSGAAIYEVLNDGSKGSDYVVKSFNNAALLIEHKTLEEVVGKSLFDLRPRIDDYGLIPVFKKVWETGEAAHFPAQVYQDDQYYNWYENTVFKLPTGEIVAIYSDVTERMKAEQELKSLNEGLEQRVIERTEQLSVAYRELEAFSYSVSHDLRAPLRVIDGWATILKEEQSANLDEQGLQSLDTICSETKRMSNLIDDLLNLAKINRVDIKPQPTDLSKIALSVVNRIRHQYPDKEVEVIIQPNLLDNCDPSLMEIALTNLFSNAFKFTSISYHPRVEFGKLSLEGRDVYYVKDNGVGFNMNYSEMLFGTFKRLHKSEEFPGTGIGLAIVKRIINRHGGQIWANSEINKWAIFYYTLNEDIR